MKPDPNTSLRDEVQKLKRLLRSSKAVMHGVATVDVEFDDTEMRAKVKPYVVRLKQR